MGKNSDLEPAVSAGIAATAGAAGPLPPPSAKEQKADMADRANFRLVFDGNDFLVSIGCLLAIFAAAALGGTIISAWFGAAAVAVISWALAEIVTRKKRMALSSNILLLAFVIALAFAAGSLVEEAIPKHDTLTSSTSIVPMTLGRWQNYLWGIALIQIAGATIAGIGALLHWHRFHVAISIAAAVFALAIAVLALVTGISDPNSADNPIRASATLICGLAVFAYALRWDMSDRERLTHRSDIAFWLHLVAPSLIAISLLRWVRVTAWDSIGAPAALGIIAVCLVFAIVALVIDRRVLLASILTYFVFSFSGAFQRGKLAEICVTLTLVVIGLALLGLPAWWQKLRKAMMPLLPANMLERLPPVG